MPTIIDAARARTLIATATAVRAWDDSGEIPATLDAAAAGIRRGALLQLWPAQRDPATGRTYPAQISIQPRPAKSRRDGNGIRYSVTLAVAS